MADTVSSYVTTGVCPPGPAGLSTQFWSTSLKGFSPRIIRGVTCLQTIGLLFRQATNQIRDLAKASLSRLSEWFYPIKINWSVLMMATQWVLLYCNPIPPASLSFFVSALLVLLAILSHDFAMTAGPSRHFFYISLVRYPDSPVFLVFHGFRFRTAPCFVQNISSQSDCLIAVNFCMA